MVFWGFKTGEEMKELSLHILDIARNSIRANAKTINIYINEDTIENILEIRIEDNGKGMNAEMLSEVTNPFFTTRNTRSVGMGISLFKAACERCEGTFEIISEQDRGTCVHAVFRYNHIDRAPMGSIPDTITAILSSQEDFDMEYVHCFNGKEIRKSNTEIKKILDGADIRDMSIITWIKEYIKENLEDITLLNN